MSLYLNSESAFILSHIRHPEFNFRPSILNAHVRPHDTENRKQDGKYDCRCYKTYKKQKRRFQNLSESCQFPFRFLCHKAGAPLQKERKPPAFHSYVDHAGKGGIAKGSFHALGKVAAPLYILFIFSNSSFTVPLSVMSAISARASDKVFPLFKSADRASVTRMRYSLRIKGKRKRNASVLLFPRSLRNQTTPPTAPKRSSTRK